MYCILHDSIIKEIKILQSGGLLELRFTSLCCYLDPNDEDSVELRSAVLRIEKPFRYSIQGLGDGIGQVDDGLILGGFEKNNETFDCGGLVSGETYRRIHVHEMINTPQKIDLFILVTVDLATIRIDKGLASLTFEDSSS